MPSARTDGTNPKGERDQMRKTPAEQTVPTVPRRVARPGSMAGLCAAYLNWCRAREYSPLTVEQHRRYLAAFFRWAAARHLTRPGQVTPGAVADYHQAL